MFNKEKKVLKALLSHLNLRYYNACGTIEYDGHSCRLVRKIELQRLEERIEVLEKAKNNRKKKR